MDGVPLAEWSPRQKALARRHVAMALPCYVLHVVTLQVCTRLPAPYLPILAKGLLPGRACLGCIHL